MKNRFMLPPIVPTSVRIRILPQAALGFVLGTLLLGAGLSADPPQGRKGQTAKNDLGEHFKNWLKEDVVYIISQEEKDIFSRLTTDEEREHFVEQFWRHRDPDPNTAENEFKVEHYRRIQYAND